MRLKPAPSLTLLLSVISGTLALAQQPDSTPPTPPSSFHAPPGQLPDRMPRPMGRDEGGMREGMHSGFRIAPPGMWWKNPDLVQKLTLTPDQQKRMGDIFQQSRLQLIDLKAAVEKQEVLLEPMLGDNPPDTNKVLAQIDHIAQARAELEKANAKMLLGIRGVLTPDQWTKLQSQERENRRMMMQRFGRSGDRGEPHGPDSHGEAPPIPPAP
jgi:Spy/CpxP family protein refolding chaperone